MSEKLHPPEARLSSGLDPGEGPQAHVLVLRLEGRDYALPVHRILEVVRMAAVTPLPEAPPWVEGVINYRGRVVPVVDLRARLGLPRREPDLSTPIVMTTAKSGAFGVITDEVVEVLSLLPDELDGGYAETAMSPALAATARRGDRLILLLDAERLHDRSLEAFLPDATGTSAEGGAA